MDHFMNTEPSVITPLNLGLLFGTLIASGMTILTIFTGHSPETVLWRASLSGVVFGSVVYALGCILQLVLFDSKEHE